MDFKALMLEQKRVILDTSHLDLPRTTNKTIPTLYLIYTTGATVEAKQLKDNVERIYRGNGITINVETLTFNQAKKAKGLKWEWVSGYYANKEYVLGKGYMSIIDSNTYAYFITYDLITASMGATQSGSLILSQFESEKNIKIMDNYPDFYVSQDRIAQTSRGESANISYRVALAAAHETLHYMLIRTAQNGAIVPYTSKIGEGDQQGHNNSEVNLNMDGQELINQKAWPTDAPKSYELHNAEKILPKQLAIIKQYLGY
jgi:hypothetical protein